MKKRIIAICLVAVCASMLFTACDNKGTVSSKAETSATTEATAETSNAPVISIDINETSAKVDRNRVVLKNEVIDEFVKLFDGKSFKKGDTVDFTAIAHDEEENTSFDKLVKSFGMNDPEGFDAEKKTVTFTREMSFTVTYDETYIYTTVRG